MSLQLGTIETLSTAFVQGEPPTLDDLLASAERDWSLRSSDADSEPPPPMTTKTQRRR